MGRNEKLPLLTPWDGAGRTSAARLKEKKLLFKSGAMDLPSAHPLPVRSDLLFRLLKSSENIGLRVLVKLRSNIGVRR